MVSSATSQLSFTATTSSSMKVRSSFSASSPPIAPRASAACPGGAATVPFTPRSRQPDTLLLLVLLEEENEEGVVINRRRERQLKTRRERGSRSQEEEHHRRRSRGRTRRSSSDMFACVVAVLVAAQKNGAQENKRNFISGSFLPLVTRAGFQLQPCFGGHKPLGNRAERVLRPQKS